MNFVGWEKNLGNGDDMGSLPFFLREGKRRAEAQALRNEPPTVAPVPKKLVKRPAVAIQLLVSSIDKRAEQGDIGDGRSDKHGIRMCIRRTCSSATRRKKKQDD